MVTGTSASLNRLMSTYPVSRTGSAPVSDRATQSQNTTTSEQPSFRFAQPLGMDDTFGRPGMAYGMKASELSTRSAAIKFSQNQLPGQQDGDSQNARGPLTQDETEIAGIASSDQSDETGAVEEDRGNPAEAARPKGNDGEPLNDMEMQTISKMKTQDAEIRSHELAHLTAAGGHARSGMRFEYQTGPDGKRYASGGEVSIDTSEENTPEKTVKKMERVRAAAMAPKNPSPQDRRVASIASQRANLARQEISEQTAEEAAAMRENQPSRENESGDSGQAKRKSILNQSAEINRLIGLRQASKAYSEPEEYLMQPETRAAQPGNPASGDFGLVTTINPPEGSVADFASIGN